MGVGESLSATLRESGMNSHRLPHRMAATLVGVLLLAAPAGARARGVTRTPPPALRATARHDNDERESPPLRVSHDEMQSHAVSSGVSAPVQRFGATAVTSGPVLAWTPLGPAPIANDYWSTGRAAGRVSALAVDPRDGNVVYLAAAGGGVWKTTNGGTNWSVLTDGLSSLSSGALAMDPQHPDTIVYGTGELHDSFDSFYGDGLFRTLDAGASWTQICSRAELGSYVARIAYHRTNSSLLYVAGSRGFMRSTNGGVNWNPTLQVNWCYDLAVNPVNSDTVYTAAYGFGIYKSVDAGQTWTQLTNGVPFSTGTASADFQRINLAISPSNPLVLYASFVDPNGLLFGMFRTSDGGLSWSHLTATPDYLGGQGWYDNCLVVDPANENICIAGGLFPYAAGNYGVIRTTNGGTSWTDITVGVDGKQVHPDQHILVFGAGGTMWLGNDGGVWKTSDGGQHWTDCNNDLSITQFYSTGLHPSNQNAILGGTQDNGTLVYNGAISWPQVIGGDGGQCLYLWNDPTYSFTTYVRLNPTYEWHNGSFVAEVTGPWGVENDRASFLLGPLSQDRNTVNTLLAGTYRVWRSNDHGATWDSLSNDLTGGSNVLRSIAVAGGAPNTIYAGASNGYLWVTTDASTWNLRNTGLPGQPINDIMVKPTDSQTAYISSDTPGGGRVWLTTNAGVSWTDVSGDLPSSLRGFCIEVDWSATPPVLYVGTDYGVYRSADGGAHWVNENVGLPSLVVYDLKLDATGGSIVAATHGRGMWRGSVGALAVGDPDHPALRLATANPVRPPAAIQFTLPSRGPVTLAIYDLAGRSVRVLERGTMEAGLHRSAWDGRDASGHPVRDGVYFLRLGTTTGSRSIKLATLH